MRSSFDNCYLVVYKAVKFVVRKDVRLAGNTLTDTQLLVAVQTLSRFDVCGGKRFDQIVVGEFKIDLHSHILHETTERPVTTLVLIEYAPI